MNILISDSWLREFIDTKATPKQIGEYLSLCGQSVERITPDGKDFVYDIEITTNRPDCLSVYGIARELSAILPRFSIPTKLKKIPVDKISRIRHSDQSANWRSVEESLSKNGRKGSLDFLPAGRQGARDDKLPLEVKISKTELCPRFTALVYDNIKIKPSPEFVQKRLLQSGIRSLNNVIDISNYLMLEIGQPMHTFDYDKILKNKMILRESKEGEEVITLDGQKRKLPLGAIIIEDGEGRIIDLCGIMGAKNSETDENTKRVLLFIQTYNPMKIRRACQALGFRTEAASRFEKGIDPEGAVLAMERATLLFKQWCGANPASNFFDIYPNPPKTKIISVSQTKINQVMGIDLKINEAKDVLDSLGIKTKLIGNKLESTIPHWRNADIDIAEDLVEEIARIYGYFNLPNVLPPLITIDAVKDKTFEWEDKIKNALKYRGYTETMSYSLVGKNLTLTEANPLKIANPLTEDLLYLRTSLVPSLLEIIAKNQQENEIKVFEMANIYVSQTKDELPKEIMTLTLCQTRENKYLEIKGMVESLLKELGIEKWEFKPDKCRNFNKYAVITILDKTIGIIGEVKLQQLQELKIKEKVVLADLDIQKLLSFASGSKKYTSLPKYPPIIEDLTFIVPPHTYIGQVLEEIKKNSQLINLVELLGSYQDTKTLRITFQSEEKNLSDKEIKPIREKIINNLKQNFNFYLKGV